MKPSPLENGLALPGRWPLRAASAARMCGRSFRRAERQQLRYLMRFLQRYRFWGAVFLMTMIPIAVIGILLLIRIEQ